MKNIEEYKKFFGSDPGKVQGIGIMTGSDATKSVAIANYDDCVLPPLEHKPFFRAFTAAAVTLLNPCRFTEN